MVLRSARKEKTKWKRCSSIHEKMNELLQEPCIAVTFIEPIYNDDRRGDGFCNSQDRVDDEFLHLISKMLGDRRINCESTFH